MSMIDKNSNVCLRKTTAVLSAYLHSRVSLQSPYVDQKTMYRASVSTVPMNRRLGEVRQALILQKYFV